MKKSWRPTLPPNKSHKIKIFEEVIKTSGFIYQIGQSQMLRQSSKPVQLKKIGSPEFKKKLAYLKKCFWKFRKLTGKGRGIAAVQVGIPESFVLVYRKKENKLWTLINPKIVNSSDKFLMYPEMCMSAAPLIAALRRPSWVKVEYYDEAGKKQVWDTKDSSKETTMLNWVLQHEIDHVRGIINIDKVDSKELIFESDKNFYKKTTFQKTP